MGLRDRGLKCRERPGPKTGGEGALTHKMTTINLRLRLGMFLSTRGRASHILEEEEEERRARGGGGLTKTK